MKYSIFVLAVIATCWSSAYAGVHNRHSSDEILKKMKKLSRKFEYERAASTHDLEDFINQELRKRSDMEFMVNFLLDEAKESVRPRLKQILDEALEEHWPSLEDFKRYSLKMYRRLESPTTTTKRKRSQFKREISEDFNSKNTMQKQMKKYVHTLIDKVKPSKRHLLKKDLDKAQKIKWTNIDKFKVYCDQIVEQYL